MTGHISRDCKCKLSITVCNSNPKWNNKSSECKSYRTCKKNLAHVFVRIVSI